MPRHNPYSPLSIPPSLRADAPTSLIGQSTGADREPPTGGTHNAEADDRHVTTAHRLILQPGPCIRYTWFALLIAALMYLLPGVIGHDPWKQDETYTFGIIDHFLRSGEWLIPVNAGVPFMEKPPLYMWVASALAWLFEAWLPLHDGARLASALFGALALVCCAHAARTSLGAQSLRDPPVIGTVALMAGTFVFAKHVHDMFSDVALMAGTALALAGLINIVAALQRQLPFSGTSAPYYRGPLPGLYGSSAALGIGVGMAIMSKGVFVPAVFCATLVVLPILTSVCRQKRYWRAVALAVLASAPFMVIWPTLLYQTSPNLFMTWFWHNNVGRFLGFSVAELGSDNAPGFVLKAMLTSGFPVAVLAVAGLVMAVGKRFLGSKKSSRPNDTGTLVSLVFSVIGLTVLSFSATARQLYLLPFALPGALLAANAVSRLPLNGAITLDWLCRMIFGLLGLLTWAIWWLMQQPLPMRQVISVIDRWLPVDYPLAFAPIHVAAAFLVSWAWLTCLPTLRTQGVWRVTLSWTAGLALVWGLIFTLLLPWINQAKSYGPVFAQLKMQLASDWQQDDCMASIGLGESEAPMLYYFTDILPKPTTSAANTSCRWLIVEGGQQRPWHAFPNWEPYWQGFRNGDTRERLEVLRRRTPVKPASARSPAQ
jgi:4-amino-4-deoxy-L-arabinose transferase-like glycosyltransferase